VGAASRNPRRMKAMVGVFIWFHVSSTIGFGESHDLSPYRYSCVRPAQKIPEFSGVIWGGGVRTLLSDYALISSIGNICLPCRMVSMDICFVSIR